MGRLAPLLQIEPAARLLAAFLLAIAAWAAHSVWGWCAVIAVTVACYLCSGVCWCQIGRYLRPLAVFLLLAIIFAEGEGGRTLIHVGAWQYTTADASSGLASAAKLLLLVASVAWFAVSAQPVEAIQALSQLLRPFKRLGVPSEDLAMATMLASRFLPLARQEAQILLLAREARGASLSKGGRAAVRHITSLVVPLLLGVLRRSDTLAAALVVKGYRRGQTGQSVVTMRVGPSECILVFISLLTAVIAFWY